MKKLIFKTITPILLLIIGVLVLGQGCGCGGSDPLVTYYLDNDADGFGNLAISVQESDQPSGYVTNSTDCNDDDASVYPGAIEVTDNDTDEDCNGLYAYTFYVDADDDGFGSTTGTVIEIDLNDPTPNGYSTNNADCEDNDASINPLAIDIENDNIDNNCDGNFIVEYYNDLDGDGYGAGNAIPPNPNGPTVGVTNNLDCDDNNANVYPYAPEIQDGIDNDCDGSIDE